MNRTVVAKGSCIDVSRLFRFGWFRRGRFVGQVRNDIEKGGLRVVDERERHVVVSCVRSGHLFSDGAPVRSEKRDSLGAGFKRDDMRCGRNECGPNETTACGVCMMFPDDNDGALVCSAGDVLDNIEGQ
jgi:hypothetical protein